MYKELYIQVSRKYVFPKTRSNGLGFLIWKTIHFEIHDERRLRPISRAGEREQRGVCQDGAGVPSGRQADPGDQVAT